MVFRAENCRRKTGRVKHTETLGICLNTLEVMKGKFILQQPLLKFIFIAYND